MSTPEPAQPHSVSPAAALAEALADSRRCLVLEYFQDHDVNTVSVRQLARYIGEQHNPNGSDDPVQATYISLIQHHLPRLEELGVIERTTDNRVSEGPEFARVAAALSRLRDPMPRISPS